jgi:hypothetical protein
MMTATGLIGSNSVRLESPDAKLSITVARLLFPFIEPGQNVIVSLSAVRIAMAPAEPESAIVRPGLIIPN